MMHIKSCSALISLTVILLTSHSAFAEDETDPAAVAEPERACFNVDRVRNFDGLTDNFLYIEIKSTEMYLLSMRNQCFGLRSAQVIAFKDTLSRICSDDSFVDVVIRDVSRPMSCRVENIERVESKAEAQAIAADREAARKAEKE
ncbi:MAG: DUF6491 family protein [Woeseiaceae bacterium]